jgi:hypothetical protein
MEVFMNKMDETELKNGVLIYLAVEDRNFVICGTKELMTLYQMILELYRDVMVAEFKKEISNKDLLMELQSRTIAALFPLARRRHK